MCDILDDKTIIVPVGVCYECGCYASTLASPTYNGNLYCRKCYHKLVDELNIDVGDTI